MLDMIESAGDAMVCTMLAGALFGAVLLIVNYDECADLQGGWADQCRGVAHTTELGVEVIETAYDVQPVVKQAKHMLDTP